MHATVSGHSGGLRVRKAQTYCGESECMKTQRLKRDMINGEWIVSPVGSDCTDGDVGDGV